MTIEAEDLPHFSLLPTDSARHHHQNTMRCSAPLQAAALIAATTHGTRAFTLPPQPALSRSTGNLRHWATKEASTSTATSSLSNIREEELFVFRSPEGDDGEFCVAYGPPDAKSALEERGYVQVENVSFVSSADEVSALLDSPSTESMSEAERQEMDMSLAQALTMMYKTQEERFEAIQTLVDGGACIKRTKSMMRASADQYNGGKNLKVLLELGGSVEDRDAYGSTALHIACVFCNADAVELLLENGADAAAKDDDGLTPKDVFARTVQRNKEIAEEYGYGSEDDRLREERIQAALDAC